MHNISKRQKVKQRLSLALWSSVLQIAVLVSLASAGMTGTSKGKLANLNISMILVNRSDGSSRLIKREVIELIAQKATLGNGESVEGLLTSNGILPDGESLGLVYILNPKLDAKTVRSATELLLPKVKGGQELSTALGEGYLVALTLDKELKRQLLIKVKDLRSLIQRMLKLEFNRFETAESRDSVIECMHYVEESLGIMRIVIRERSRPLSSEMLRQVVCEIDVLALILNNLTKGQHKLSRTDAETIKQIAEDFKIRMKSFSEERGPGDLPSKWPEGLVSVRVRRSGNREEVHGLRIYYVPEALWNIRHKIESSFRKLSSPTEQSLPVATYFFWAGKPGDSTPLSDRKKESVRKSEMSEKIEVELVIIEE